MTNGHTAMSQTANASDTTASTNSQEIEWTLTPAITIGRAIVSASQRLAEAGCDPARLDAQVILAHVLGKDRSWLFSHHEYELSEAEIAEYTELIARRARREPVAYLIGRKEFYGLEFLVDRRVLIPRPETELLVDAVLGQINSRPGQRAVVADVGAGSGAIGIAVAVNAPHCRVYGLDVSADALAVAKQNVERLDERGQVTLLQSDLLENLPEPVDIIAANLPYIAPDTLPTLDPDVRDYEPTLALAGGDNGIELIKRLLDQAPHHLAPDGTILLEIGHDQADAVQSLVKEMSPQPRYVGIRQDYSGNDRLVTIEF
jgi:release factor glutamine methyltransferase